MACEPNANVQKIVRFCRRKIERPELFMWGVRKYDLCGIVGPGCVDGVICRGNSAGGGPTVCLWEPRPPECGSASRNLVLSYYDI